MRKIDLGQAISILANLGVIAGIVFLAFELHQNNELLELEARATMSQNMQDGWERISSDPVLVELFIKDRSEQSLNESEEFRLNAFWMGYLIRLEWRYRHVPEANQRIAGFRRTYASYPSLRRTWNGDTEGSRGAGKDNFSQDFINHIEGIIQDEDSR